jgi:hypothetical protein
MNLDIVNLGTSLSILSNDISNKYVNNTTLSTLSDTIDDEFTTTITYVDDKVQEQHEYTDQEIENLRNAGYIQEAVTQLLAWATSDVENCGLQWNKLKWNKHRSRPTHIHGIHCVISWSTQQRLILSAGAPN